jgi:hypothetical protein
MEFHNDTDQPIIVEAKRGGGGIPPKDKTLVARRVVLNRQQPEIEIPGRDPVNIQVRLRDSPRERIIATAQFLDPGGCYRLSPSGGGTYEIAEVECVDDASASNSVAE